MGVHRDAVWTDAAHFARGIILWTALSLLATPSSIGAAPEGKLEEVVAVVGEHAILKSEVEEQAALLAPQLQIDLSDSSAARTLRHDILNRLVDDQVLVLEAKTQSLEVSEEEVQESVTRAIGENIEQFGGEAGFLSQLQKEGMSRADLESRYREEAKKQLVAGRLIARDVRPQVELSEADVRKFWDENRERLPKKPRSLHVQNLFLRVRPDSVLSARARERAAELRVELEKGLDFAEAARKNSDAPDAESGGSLGRFPRGQLEPVFEQVAYTIAVGEVSAPIESRFGWHLLRINDRAPDSSWVDVSHVLFEVAPTRSDESKVLERAISIRRQVVGGSLDFVAAVQRFSDDTETRARDGDLGWIPMSGFAGAVKTTMDTLRVGRVSQPVLGDGGVHLFRLLGEEAEGSYRFEEVQAELKQLASQQKLEEALRAYVDRLRLKYFVEIRAYQ